MARFFQIPNFKRDEYQRPEQKWVCGRACEGKGCPFGPDSGGVCHTTGECRPVREGERWKCTRPETHGGACAEGPMPDGECCRQIGPCQPVPSLRTLRGRCVIAAVLFTAGLLLTLLGGSARERSVDPGPLTSAHAQSNARCGDCHAPAAAGGDGRFVGVRRPTSAACLRCHSLGDHPLAPHGLDGAALAAASAKSGRSAAGASAEFAVLSLAKLARAPDEAAGDCATCHKEHRGRGASLTEFSNGQCQVCHLTTFATFAEGHPDFGDYPFRRRTRIVFDHAKHMQVHFADPAFSGAAPKGCDACHVASAAGGFMTVKGFDQACSACHGAQVEGEGRAGDKGLAFFRVPGLDAPTLAAKGRPVGDWPSDADGRITPFMALLLSSDPAAKSALRVLGDADLLDLGGAAPERLAAAETLAWSIKSLLADLVARGQDALISRMGGSDPGADRGQLRAMTAQMPRDGLIAAQSAWFPNLLAEVASHRAGIQPSPSSAPKAAAPAPAAAKVPATAAGDDLLADAPPAPAARAEPAKPAGDDLASDDLSAGSNPAKKPPAPEAPALSPIKMADPEAWAVAGGWYRSMDNFTLYYRPSGHADPFLAIWLTVTARLSGNAQDKAAQTLFEALSDREGPGLCVKCHSVERAPHAGALLVNWRASLPAPAMHGMTKFDHSVHFSLIAQQGCQTCHQLRPQDTGLAASVAVPGPAKFASNFASVSKATCASCHNDKDAREDCLLCHNYHTGEISSRIVEMGPLSPKAADPKDGKPF